MQSQGYCCINQPSIGGHHKLSENAIQLYPRSEQGQPKQPINMGYEAQGQSLKQFSLTVKIRILSSVTQLIQK